jgi:hypothetical protein
LAGIFAVDPVLVTVGGNDRDMAQPFRCEIGVVRRMAEQIYPGGPVPDRR